MGSRSHCSKIDGFPETHGTHANGATADSYGFGVNLPMVDFEAEFDKTDPEFFISLQLDSLQLSTL